LTIEPGPVTSIGLNTTSKFDFLAPGNHVVTLGSVPLNCTVGGDNPRTLEVTAGATTQTSFRVECARQTYIAFERVSDRGDKDICLLDPNFGEASVECITGGPGDTANDVHPAWGPEQEWLIFASDRDGDYELYTMNVDGSNVTQLTNNDVYDGDPDLYFSGIWAIFTSERHGNKDIYEMDLTQPGNPVTRLTFDAAADYNPTFMWDNTQLRMFTSNRDGDQHIYRVSVSDPGNVSHQTLGDFKTDDVWWMPPNLYYSSTINGGWDVIRAPNGVPLETFFGGSSIDQQPAPGPNGWWVAVVSNKDGNFEIYKKNWSTGEVVRLTNNATADTRPAWFSYWPWF
jgi:Tol biopolymer transport system component